MFYKLFFLHKHYSQFRVLSVLFTSKHAVLSTVPSTYEVFEKGNVSRCRAGALEQEGAGEIQAFMTTEYVNRST